MQYIVTILLCLISQATGFFPSHLLASSCRGFVPNAFGLPTASQPLYNSMDDTVEEQPAGLSIFSSKNVKFLGRGSEAIVRPGVVLLSPPDEHHHFLKEAAVYIYAMGVDKNDTYVIRGVILDQPTPFTIGEMMAKSSETSDEDSEPEFLKNLIYRGGEWGDSAIMFHSDKKLAEQTGQEMIGDTGVYQGGMDHVLSTNYPLDPKKAKFFFSFMEFTETEMETMLANREGKGTEWLSIEVPPAVVLSSELEKGEAWARLRSGIRDGKEAPSDSSK